MARTVEVIVDRAFEDRVLRRRRKKKGVTVRDLNAWFISIWGEDPGDILEPVVLEEPIKGRR